jgi:hypothetical protein
MNNSAKILKKGENRRLYDWIYSSYDVKEDRVCKK